MTDSPASAYVHIPFCRRRCFYCDFPISVVGDRPPVGDQFGTIAEYVEILCQEIAAVRPNSDVALQTIFFGGGTPSLLSGPALDTLLTTIRTLLPIQPDAEITLEANPGTVETDKFATFRDAGINRISLGIQSFNPMHLKALGRIHDEREARRAIEIAATHFDNFNLDLMYGLPGQTVEQALSDLETALSFAPPHLSCYQLTIEANTAFAASPPVLPDHDTCADMQNAIESRLASGNDPAGYTHYETSAFARAGRQCRHK